MTDFPQINIAQVMVHHYGAEVEKIVAFRRLCFSLALTLEEADCCAVYLPYGEDNVTRN